MRFVKKRDLTTTTTTNFINNKQRELETRVFAPPHLHIVAYFWFSFLSFLCPSSPVVCREDCEEQNPVEKLWLRPYASHKGKRIKSGIQFC